MLSRRPPLLFRGGVDSILRRIPLGGVGGTAAVAKCQRFISRLQGRLAPAEALEGRVAPTEALEGRVAPTEALSGRFTDVIELTGGVTEG